MASKPLGAFFVHHLGPLGARPTVVVVGRSNLNKRSTSIDSLLSALHAEGFSVCWYECIGGRYARLRQHALEQIGHAWLNAFVRHHALMGRLATRAVRLCLKLKYPKRRCFLLAKWADSSDPVHNLRCFLAKLAAPEVMLLSHSAGGIAASMSESDTSVKKVVCFGYPFKHPDKPDEAYRTAHLAAVSKPFLIIQGARDEYGTAQDAQRYALSPHIEVCAIDSDHDYDSLDPLVLNQVSQLVLQFLKA